MSVKWGVGPADTSPMTNTPEPELEKWSLRMWLVSIPIAIVIATGIWAIAHVDTNTCPEYPNGPGCFNGQQVDDPAAEDALKAMREASK